MAPTTGRIVRYVTPEGETLPAIITKVHEGGTVNLTCFADDELKRVTSVAYDGDFTAQEAVDGIPPAQDDAGKDIPGTGWAGTPARPARDPMPSSWHWPLRG